MSVEENCNWFWLENRTEEDDEKADHESIVDKRQAYDRSEVRTANILQNEVEVRRYLLSLLVGSNDMNLNSRQAYGTSKDICACFSWLEQEL
jgi:hypothetical protein